MTAYVILNPFSGRGSAGDRKKEVSAALTEAEVDYEIVLTEAPRHATTLARKAAEAGKTPIIAGGGDGLIGEVVNGIGQVVGDSDWPEFGILPLGTANDLVDNLNLPRDLNDAASRIASGILRDLDICKANEHYFLNNAGLGLESHISIIQNQMTWAKGDFRYILAALRGIMHNPEWVMRLEWDSGSYEGPIKMISIGNGARTGGVFFTVPHADPFDGKITFVYGTIPSRLGIMAQFPNIMKPGEGNYVEHPAVHEVSTTRLNVVSETSTPLHADGEILSEAIKEINFEILPGKLPLLFGKSILILKELYWKVATAFLRLFFKLLYGPFAWAYDGVAASVSLGRWTVWVLSVAPYLPGPRVLEIGFGRGHLLRALTKAGIWVAGIDSSYQMTQLSILGGKKEGVLPMIVNGYAQSLPFLTGYFNQVVATFPAEYIWETPTLQEVHRVLQSGGQLVLLPAAWITGSGLLDRFARLLFHITGQAPDLHDKNIETQIISRLETCGFSVTIEKLPIKKSLVLIVQAQKPD